MRSKQLRRKRAKPTNPTPIPTTVVVGIVTPDSTCRVDDARDGVEVVGDGVVEDDIAVTASTVVNSVVSLS
jgi:hypothetical protein